MGRKMRPEKNPDRSTHPKAIRARLRAGTEDPEWARIQMGGKHIDDWSIEELARGRPKNDKGTFQGSKPAWVTDEMAEEAQRRFKKWLRSEMMAGSISAVSTVKELVFDAESDRVRLDAAKFLLEHVVGKPQQEITGDVRMNIQHLLAGVLVTPEGAEAIDAEIIDDDDDSSDDWSDDED